MAQNIKNYIRGDSRVVNVQVNNSDGTPFNLTGCKVYFTVNSSNAPTDDSTDVFQLTTTTHTNAALGQTQFQITNAQTQNMTPGTYYYDVQVKDTLSNITSMGQGTFSVVADITRSIA